MRSTKSHRAKFQSGVVLCRHIRVHIRTAEGNAQFPVHKSARSVHIRPQRKFACSRFFKINSMFRALLSALLFNPSTKPTPGNLSSFPYLSGGFYGCIIPDNTQFVNRLIPLFSKLHFVHDSLPALAPGGCAFRAKVTLIRSHIMQKVSCRSQNLKNYPV